MLALLIALPLIGLALWFTCEKRIMNALGNMREPSPGLSVSLERVAEEWPELGPAPRLLEVVDPLPNGFWIRVSGSAPCIGVTRGLIDALDEEELRAVLLALWQSVLSSTASSETFCASLSVLLMRFAPRGWTSLTFSPLGFVGWMVLVPWLRFLIWASGRTSRRKQIAPSQALDGAMRKLWGLRAGTSYSGHPGLMLISLLPPESLSQALQPAPLVSKQVQR